MILRNLCTALTLASLQVHASDMTFNRLSVEQGLSQSTVNAILEDRLGLMWFGTQDGLNLYDGYTFTVFKHDPADTNSISDNWITSLCKDRDGNIWIGTLEGGLNLYPANRDRFIHFRNDPGDTSSLSGNNVAAILQDASGALWIGAWGGGLNKYDHKTRSFRRFHADEKNPSSLSNNQVHALMQDAYGALWVGTWNGLNRLNRTETGFTRYLFGPSRATGARGEQIAALYESSDSTLWVGTRDKGLMVYDRKNDRVIPYSSPAQSPLNALHIWALCGGSGQSLWIAASGNGVLHFDPVSGTTMQYANDPSDPTSLFNNSALRIFRDSRDIVWIGTEGGGITTLNRQPRRFRHYFHNRRDPHSLQHNLVRAITEGTDGSLWIGTQGSGLSRFDPTTQQFHSYRHGVSAAMLNRNDVFSLYDDKAGRLWIGTDVGLYGYNHASRQFKKVPLGIEVGQTQQLANITALVGDGDGAVWIGTYGDGLLRYDPGTGKCTRFRRKPGDGTSLNGDWILSLLVDTNGELWVGTWGTGLGKFDKATSTFRRYRYDRSDPGSLSNNTVNCLATSQDGTLWVGTSAGLNKLDRNTGRFIVYSEKDGLPNGVIYGIIEDDERNLWLSTNNGIARFDPTTKASRNFEVSDGLQGNEFNNASLCRTKAGQFFFGGVNGLTAFFPAEIRDDTTVSPVVLTSFKIFDKPARLPRSISITDSIEITYAENFFSFEFVALNYVSPSKSRYAYMMEGFDRDWVHAGTRRYASYTHLDPGEYVFRVRASNSDGVWDMTGAAVHIHIVPPLWRTWWFRLGLVLVATGVVLTTYQRRVRAIKRDQRAQQEFSIRLMESQESERKRIAGELHDSLGQNLLVIRNRALLGLKGAELSKQARDQLDQISSVATQAIDEVREISYDLRPYQLDRLGLTKAIRSITSSLASSVQFSMDVDSIDDEVGKDQAIHVYRIVQEGINNILKHAGASEASVLIRVEKDNLRITIGDNGKGIPQDSPDIPDGRHGFGLVGISERAKVMNGTMTMESAPDKGTALTVLIPRLRKTA